MDFPSAIHDLCPNCKLETLHKVLKGKIGKHNQLTLDCTIRCTACGHIHHAIITEKKLITVSLIISDQEKSFKSSIELHPDEEIILDQEMVLGEKNIKISSIEVSGARKPMAIVKDISTIWCKLLDSSGKLHIKVSVHKRSNTMSYEILALPDEEFFIGDIIKIGRDNVAVFKIKTRNKVVKYNSALAEDIVRIYGRVIR